MAVGSNISKRVVGQTRLLLRSTFQKWPMFGEGREGKREGVVMMPMVQGQPQDRFQAQSHSLLD